MLVFFSAALLIYGAMHGYALGKLWLALPHSPGLGWALLIWGLAMTLSPLIPWLLARQNWHGATALGSWAVYVWMGFLFLFCSIALALDLSHALATFFDFKWPLDQTSAFLTMFLLALALLGYGFVEARQINVQRISITTPKLSPAVRRVSIAQISDLHLGAILGSDFLERIIAKLRDMQPDILVATGDIVDGQGDEFNSLAKHLLALKPAQGAYAIIGNHEVYAGLDNSLRFLCNAGFTVLRGEAASAGGIMLVGIDDPSAGAPDQQASLATERALAAIPKDNFIVLLKHQPVVNSDANFDLQLSGHVHGGQIFPFGLLTRLAYGVRTGLTPLADRRWLYVSRGAGTWGPPIRLFAAPEITLITITSATE